MVHDRYPKRELGNRRHTTRSNSNAILNGEINVAQSRSPISAASHSPPHTRHSQRFGHQQQENDDDGAANTNSVNTTYSPSTSRQSHRRKGGSVVNGAIIDEGYSRTRPKREHLDANDKQSPLSGNDDNTAEAEASSTNRICTRRSLRSTPQIVNDEHYMVDTGHGDPSHEEQRRSSRQRRLQYKSYKEEHSGSLYKPHREEGNSPVAEDEQANDADNMDMYTRVKRARRKIKRDMYGMALVEEEEKTTEDEESENEEEEEGDDDDEEEEEDEEEDREEDEEAATGQYNLRRNKPRTKLYEATIERKTRDRYFKDTPPKRKYKNMSEIKFKSPAHRRHKRKRAHHRTSSTSSSGSESEDERRFARRKNKSMAKARQRCLPMNLSQADLSHTMKDRQKIGSSLADIDPMSVDRTVTFDSVGGLGEHLQALKEMIVFPLLYPEVFERFKISPPRGVLFHGPPGTGKTLVARALANECSTGEKRVAFFMRKGADCLSKWVGESERQLRLLFDQAYQVRPSIIFFDEIDGLAPVRSSRQDQIHSSIVSTLLALMDGLDSRGEVVVIGATNRIDSIDPALRRPGRFDREFLFNLPPVEARADILRIHTKEWNPKLLDRFIFEVASKCNGYCGADMKALCTEAALHALRRRYPQIYTSNDKLQLDVTSIDISGADFYYAMTKIVPAGQRAVISPSRPLSVIIKPLLKHQMDMIVSQLNQAFPYLTQPQTTCSSSLTNHLLDAVEDDSNLACVTECPKFKRKSKQGTEVTPFLDFSITAYSRPIVCRPRLLLYGDPTLAHSTHLAPALLHCMEKMPVHTLDIPTLYSNSAKTPEESCSQVFREARRATPSVIYIPHIGKWWQVLSDTMQATFLMMLNDLDPLIPILLLATADTSSHMLPVGVRQLFTSHSAELYEIGRPKEAEVRLFFEDLLLRQTCVPPPTRKQAARNLLEVLPKVAVTKPAKLTNAEETTLWNEEETVLRELRLFLRDMLNKLARDRKFNIFSKPVDIEEVPDYHEIIETPMDLSTMMSKIDLHNYQACEEFLNDIDLICANALEYNPADSIAGRAIRHRACALKDMAHALVGAELDEDFEKQCLDILESRRNRGKSPSKSAPKYYHTKPLTAQGGEDTGPTPSRYSRRLRREASEATTATSGDRRVDRQSTRVSHDITQDDLASPVKKKRRKRSRWSKGMPSASASKKRRASPEDEQDEESEEETGDNKEAVQTNGHFSDHASEKSDTPQSKVLTEESPIGDVTHTKIDLNNILENKVGSSGEGDTIASLDSHQVIDNVTHQCHNIINGPTEATTAGGDTTIDTVTNDIADAHCAANRIVTASHINTQIELVVKQRFDNTDIQENIQSDVCDLVVSDVEATDSNHSTSAIIANSGDAMDSIAETAATSPVAKETKTSPVTKETKPSPVTKETKTSPVVEEMETTCNKETATASSPVAKELVVELALMQPKRMTRSMTTDSHVTKCMEILEELSPPFIIDKTRLPALLDKAVVIGLLCNISELEKLYSLLAQRIYHHRSSYDRTALLQEIDNVLDSFAESR